MTKKSSSHKKTKPKKQPSSTKKFAMVFLVLVVVAVLAFFAMVYVTAFAKTDRDKTVLTVGDGDTYYSLLADDVWQNKPLASGALTRLYLKFHAKKPLQKGKYDIPAGVSLAEAVKILEQGAKIEQVKIQIIEGKTIKDLYYTLKTTTGVQLNILSPLGDTYTWQDVKADNQKVAAALGFDDKDTPNGNLEGLFAPNTYLFNVGVTDEAILRRLYDAQKRILDKAWQGRDENLPYKTAYEVLIMASIIEKETGIKSERADVSAVFVNRLRKGMKLQTDPTIIYGLFDRYDGNIYRSNIDEKTDYNTYQIAGLPPTPIALPSADAIDATMHPSDVPYLFFVATGKGGHKFSTNLADHQKAVAEYRAVMANR